MLPLYRFLVQTTDTCAHVIKVYGIFTGMERAWLQGAHEARHEVRKEREKRREERALDNPVIKEKSSNMIERLNWAVEGKYK